MRPAALELVEVSTGAVLDTVTLHRGVLRFATGAADGVLAGQRERFGWTGIETYDHFTGWSNGYAALRPR